MRKLVESPLSAAYLLGLAVEWGSDRTREAIDGKSASFSRLAGNPARGVQGGKMAHSLRSLGSAALNYAMVAQGGLDLYWYFDLSNSIIDSLIRI